MYGEGAVLIDVSDYHGTTPPVPWNCSQEPLPFLAHSPIHPILIPDYDALDARYSRNLRQEEPLTTPKVRASQLKKSLFQFQLIRCCDPQTNMHCISYI
jgi:hypothetical protein